MLMNSLKYSFTYVFILENRRTSQKVDMFYKKNQVYTSQIYINTILLKLIL